MSGGLSNYYISWAFGILTSTPFRILLIVMFVVALIRLLLGRITGWRFLKISAALVLFGFIPRLVYFFHALLMH